MPCENGGVDIYIMPVDAIDPTHPENVWEPRDKDIKRYVHFDRKISYSKLKLLANDPKQVASHAFFPLLLFKVEWVKFRKAGRREKKTRPIRYSSRIDAAIFARYRSILSKLYEKELDRRGLSAVPVAYRKLPKAGGGHKCNIDIAKDVFLFIREVGDCFVTVVDIKAYFESLDHDKIRYYWEALLGHPLPPDHEAVFKAVTKYTVVDLRHLFQRLELHSPIGASTRQERRTRKVDQLKRLHYKQICTPVEFRTIVAGSTPGRPSLLQKNGFDFGIPQGTPISDIIANFYLLDFDQTMNAWAESLGGIYRRYSDDIVVIIPKREDRSADEAKKILQKEIKKHGRHLKIQDKKVCYSEFYRIGSSLKYNRIYGKSSPNGLEYLGFEFNGENVKIKNSTLSNAWRKIKRRAYGHASRYVKQYRGKGKIWLAKNYPAGELETKFLRDVTYSQDISTEKWTFVKYAKRASKTFIGFNAIFSRQTRRYRRYTKLIINNAFAIALRKHA